MAKMKALVTPSVIKWARESAHYSLEAAAKKIGVKPERLKEWEGGKSLPSMAQARKMSIIYRRPLAAFYLPQPPKDFPLLQDFRTVGGKPVQYSPPLVFLMRQIQERQAWLREYLKEQGQEELRFIGSGSLQSSPKALSKKIIKTLWGGEKEYSQAVSKNKTAKALLNSWFVQCEEKGIFISRAGNLNPHNALPVREARGFVISDKYAPFVFVNSGDSKAAQLFTLLHELAHLWLDVSGVPDHFPAGRRARKPSIEFLCNQTTAEILMPEEKIKDFPKMTCIQEIKGFVAEQAKKFPASRLALLVRLKSFSLLSNADFENLKEQYGKEHEQRRAEQKKKMKESKGGPNANLLKIYANGESFTKIVAYSYKEGLISGREASGLLDMKLNRMEKILPMLA